jgi:AhpC/TSA family
MNRVVGRILVLVVGLSVVAAVEGEDKAATPAEQYKALLKEYQDARADLAKVKTDEERKKIIERRDKLPPRFLELAEKNPKDPVAVDALIEMVWFSMPGSDKALALLQREHVRSDRLGQVHQQTAFGSPQDVTILHQVAYGLSKENEAFLRAVLEMNPHKDIQGQACLALAELHSDRCRRLDLAKDRQDLAKQYEALVGKEYFEELQRNRAETAKEAESLFERAAEKYGDVKFPSGGTVGEKAKTALFGIRDLIVGKAAPDIEGEDQDAKPFKLSDYRGKVVLLYFWHEF